MKTNNTKRKFKAEAIVRIWQQYKSNERMALTSLSNFLRDTYSEGRLASIENANKYIAQLKTMHL